MIKETKEIPISDKYFQFSWKIDWLINWPIDWFLNWFNRRYLVTEGQIFSVYFITFVVMIGYMMYKKQKHNAHLDINGQFLLYSFAMCFILILIWVAYLWNDEALRVKYPGLLYIPEPWSYYTLYIKPWFNTVNMVRVYRK